MNNRIRVLVLEDSATDAELNLRELRRAGYEPEWRRVEAEADFTTALESHWDVILADFGLPGWDSMEALALLQSRGLDIPFIIVSGTIGEETAVAAMRHGAADYLLKDRLARLGPTVGHALNEKRLRAERRATDEALRRRMEDLERFHRLTVGRELQMIELKQEVNELARLAGLPPRHDLSFLTAKGTTANPASPL